MPTNKTARRRPGAAALRQAALLRLSAEIAAAHDEADVCHRVVKGLHDDALGYDFLGVFLVDDATGDRVLRASIGWPDAPPDWRLRPGQGLSERPLLDGRLHYTPEVTRDSRYAPALNRGSEVDLPLQIDGRTVGVLIVDDDPAALELMTRLLTGEGFAVVTAASGDLVLQLAKQLRPLAITLDVQMPGMDGWSVLATCKSTPELRDIPVIMVMDEATGQYFTLLYGVLDLDSRELRTVCAGHPRPVRLGRGRDPEVIEAAGVPIGWLPGFEYQESRVSLAPGDRIYFYSDGVIEARNPRSEFFTTERLVRTLAESRDLRLEESLGALMASLAGWREGGRPDDDVSMIALEIHGH